MAHFSNVLLLDSGDDETLQLLLASKFIRKS